MSKHPYITIDAKNIFSSFELHERHASGIMQMVRWEDSDPMPIRYQQRKKSVIGQRGGLRTLEIFAGSGALPKDIHEHTKISANDNTSAGLASSFDAFVAVNLTDQR